MVYSFAVKLCLNVDESCSCNQSLHTLNILENKMSFFAFLSVAVSIIADVILLNKKFVNRLFHISLFIWDFFKQFQNSLEIRRNHCSKTYFDRVYDTLDRLLAANGLNKCHFASILTWSTMKIPLFSFPVSAHTTKLHNVDAFF